MLPDADIHYLQERVHGQIVGSEAGMICVIIPNFPLPSGLEVKQADLLLRISPGYPDVAPDMWWFDPPINRVDHKSIPATDVYERHLGRTWQRWSRHLSAGQWRSGTDSLESYVALIARQLHQAAGAHDER
jgi:hypothetical protein